MIATQTTISGLKQPKHFYSVEVLCEAVTESVCMCHKLNKVELSTLPVKTGQAGPACYRHATVIYNFSSSPLPISDNNQIQQIQ